jgi:hypothetical protein
MRSNAAVCALVCSPARASHATSDSPRDFDPDTETEHWSVVASYSPRHPHSTTTVRRNSGYPKRRHREADASTVKIHATETVIDGCVRVECVPDEIAYPSVDLICALHG